MASIEQKQLQGLTYRTSKRKEIIADGKKKIIMETIERPLQVKDVLSATDYGDSIRIVTADGRKHDILAIKQPAGGKGKGKDKEENAGTGAGAPEGNDTGAGQNKEPGKTEGE